MKQKGFAHIILLSCILLTGLSLFFIFYSGRDLKNQSIIQMPTLSSDEESTWVIYTSVNEPGLSFKYPPYWKFSKKQSISKHDESFEIASNDGTKVIFEYDPLFLGGVSTCDDHDIIKSVTPLPNARNLYFVNLKRKGGFESFGVDEGIERNGKIYPPKLGDTGGCFYHINFKSKSNPNKAISFDVAGFIDSDGKYDETVLKILSSLKY